MTAVSFEEWLRRWDKQLKEKKCFFRGNSAAHLRLLNLRNIQLQLLPKNTTSLIQPMDQGVIRNFKHFYRRMILEEIEDGLLESDS